MKKKSWLYEAKPGEPISFITTRTVPTMEVTKNNRKEYPLFEGLMKYFPNALMEVAHCSYLGNIQHHPDKPLHWDKNKSSDHKDALMRHLLESGTLDDDEILHDAKVAWRALANLEILLTTKTK